MPQRAFTLVEILISILILALGVLGLGILFPVVIREQRIGADVATGVAVVNSAKSMLTRTNWAAALPAPAGFQSHPFAGDTPFLWQILRNHELLAPPPAPTTIRDGLGAAYAGSASTVFQPFAAGQWFPLIVPNAADPNTPCGTIQLGYPNVAALFTHGGQTGANIHIRNGTGVINCVGCVNLSIAQRLYPLSEGVEPQFIWDIAVQRAPSFNFHDKPDTQAVRAVIFVRRIDPRIRFTGGLTSLLDALPTQNSSVPVADQRVPLGEDQYGNPTLDGTNGDRANPGLRYSGIKTAEVEFFYKANTPALNHPDRLYMPSYLVNSLSQQALALLWAQMKQPGQKLVDNMGNVYTVVGSGNEPGVAAQSFDNVAGGDYIQVDPPVPVAEGRASPAAPAAGANYQPIGNTGVIRRAIWQVAFTPQIPVAVNVVELLPGDQQ